MSQRSESIMSQRASGRNGKLMICAANGALMYHDRGKGLFVALAMMYEGHLQNSQESATFDRVRSVCITAFTILKATTVYSSQL